MSAKDRQLLLTRAHNIAVSDRLKHSLSRIQQKEEKLSQSRCSSHSSKSIRSISSTQSHNNTSKVRILHNIVQMLKSPNPEPKSSLHKPQYFNHLLPNYLNNNSKPSQVGKNSQVGEGSVHKNQSKLHSMLKVIKKCNQQSTKAVSTVKKDSRSNSQVEQRESRMLILDKGMETSIQAKQLADELKMVKEENKMLIQLIKLNELKRKTENKCQACGCLCTKPKQLKEQKQLLPDFTTVHEHM